MASVKLRVYVVLGDSGSSNFTMRLLPLIFDTGIFRCGGDNRILLLFLRFTYSLKVKINELPSSAMFVAPGRGFISTINGGMVSLSPPEGDSVVLAHE
ncbi:unknown [Bacteroides sp. CAG:1060]|nr:unknown [Bacteroides sp. CAG:1060]